MGAMTPPPVRTTLACASLALLTLLFASVPVAPTFAAQDDDGASSVETAGAVVVHGVATGVLAARLKAVDRQLASAEFEPAVAELDALLGEDLDVLHEDSEGVYLTAEDAVLLRLAALPDAALARWRGLADARAAALLADAGKPGAHELLERGARRLALTTDGPRLLVALADLRLARGDLARAARLLEDLLHFWPAVGSRAELPGVERAAVISRLVAAAIGLGDAASIRALARDLPQPVLSAPSVALAEHTVADELEAAEAAAQRRSHLPRAPTGSLRLAAEVRLAPWDLTIPLPDRGREITGHPAAVTGKDGTPMLLARVTDSYGIDSRLHAFAPAKDPESSRTVLRPTWGWPSSEEIKRFPRAAGNAPFEPVVVGDLVLLCWPSTRTPETDGERHAVAEGDELRDLVMLSISGEGRLIDQRGVGEDRRPDGDPELARLSFCGPPLVLGNAVYVTLAGRSQNGGASELHIARFDLVFEGGDAQLVLRWRRHVVDGTPIPPSRFAVNELAATERELAFPTGLAARFGLLYVGSNTGAVACVDSDDGKVVWLEIYDRLGPSPRRPITEANPVGWKYGPVRIDGDRVAVAPRDGEELLLYSARPLPSRSMRRSSYAVRGMGSATRAGTLPGLGNLLADEFVSLHEGRAILSGSIPAQITNLVRSPPAPLIAYRLEGGPGSRMTVPEIPELTASGSSAVFSDAILFPTFKAIYRVPLSNFGGTPQEMWRVRAGIRGRLPDRIGNVVAHNGHVWSVTPSRIVLFESQ